MKSFKTYISEAKVEEVLGSIELDEAKGGGFTADQINKLKLEYGKINKIDPDSLHYKKLVKMLDAMPDTMLKSVAGGDIKFMSPLAQNRMTKRGIKEDLDEAFVKPKGVPNDELNYRKTGGQYGKVRRFPYFVVAKNDKNFVAYNEKDMSFFASAGTIEQLIKLMNPYVKQYTGNPIVEAANYTVNHKTYSSAVQHATAQAEKQGYTVDEEDYDRKVALGPKKPSSGKTNSFTIDLLKNGKPQKKKLHMQIYNADDKFYELNMYIQ